MSIIPAYPNEPGTSPVTTPVLVDSGTTTTLAADSAEHFAGGYFNVWGTLVNDGLIWSRPADGGSGANAVAVNGDLADLSNFGTIVARAPIGDAVAVSVMNSFTAGDIANGGEIFALAAAANAWGVRSTRGPDSITNDGTIAVQAFTDPLEPYDPFWPRWTGKAYGIQESGGNCAIVNGSAGQILVEGDWAVGIWARGSAASAGIPYDIDNRGLIQVVSTSVGQPSYGLLLANTTDAMNVINSGTIEADVAIFAPSSGLEGEFGGIFDNAQSITNTETGTLRGDVILRNGADILANRGLIDGDVDMGAGDDSLDTSAGTITGLVHLGTGNDSFAGSASFDRVVADSGNDTLQGNGGSDLLLGGAGDDTLIGGGGNDGLYGGYGDDRLVIAGGDSALGGAGDDRLELAGYSFRLADGGDGFDTLVLPAGSRVLDLSAVASTLRVSGIEEIVLGGGKELVVRAGDVASITGGGNELRIDGTSADTVDLVGSWAAASDRVIDGVTYRVYASGAATVLVAQPAAVVVGAVAPSAAAGLDAVASGSVAPDASLYGLDPDQDLHAIYDSVLANDTEIRIEAYEVWHNFEGTSVLYSTETATQSATSILNYGEVSSSGDIRTVQALGIWYGSVSNHGLVRADNSGAGDALAIRIGASGTIDNDGDIVATSGTGDAYAIQTFDQRDVEGVPSVVNGAGGYIGALSSFGYAEGIFAGNSPLIRNDGLIEVQGRSGAVGVDEFNAGGDLVNTGQIYASIAAGGAGESIGFAHYGFGSLVNSGLIAADVAVYFVLRYGETFDLSNSGEIDGEIILGLFEAGAVYGHFNLANSGEIHGSVLVHPDTVTRDTIVNDGWISGDVSLAGGNDSYDGSSGTVGGQVDGGAGADVLTGGAAGDRLFGGSGDDTLVGAGGADILEGGAGNDSIDGGAGLDFASYSGAAAGVRVNLGLSGPQDTIGAGNDVLAGIESLIGSEYRDRLTGNSGSNKLFGLGGNDVLDGGAGADAMFGGTGDDVYYADSYSDRAVENAGEGTDGVVASDNFRLGANIETLTLTGSATIWGYGNGLDNVLTGNAAANKLFGLDGNDTIDGGAGNDLMFGGLGDDRFYADSYSDRVVENAGEGTDTVFASANFRLSDNVEKLVLTGSSGLWGYGNALDNTLSGNAAANKLFGLAGDDTLVGGDGNDRLDGGAGQDRLFGGLGADTFVFRDGDFAGLTAATCDQIKDFTQGEDRIDLRAVDADTTLAGDQAFAFIGSDSFHNVAGELRYEQIAGNSYLYGDTDGDGIADFMIRVDASHAFTSGDLLI